ncbi:MAG: ABC transporter substrate-binding protein [Vicinamibacterales bacterium]
MSRLVARSTRAAGPRRHAAAGLVAAALAAAAIATTAARAPETVVLGVGSAPGSAVYLQVDVAKALGYFADEGIDVRIQNFRGGAVAGTALIGGSVDVSANAIDHVIKARQQGKDLRFIASFAHLPALPLVVAEKYRGVIKTVADLKDRPIGVTAPGSATDLLMRVLFLKAGLDPKSARLIGVGSNTMPAALEHDQVHAAIGLDPWATDLVRRGKAFVLVDFRTEKDTRTVFGGPYQLTGLLTRADVIAKRPAALQHVVNAVVRANRWMAANPVEKWADLLPREIVGDRSSFVESMKASKDIFSADSLPRREGVVNVLLAFDSTGQVPGAKSMNPDDLVDLQFVKKARP